ncbi:uncharacterized protein FYN12_012633 [Phoenicopterus ruber ruber]
MKRIQEQKEELGLMVDLTSRTRYCWPQGALRTEPANRTWRVSQGVARQFARQLVRKGAQGGHSHPAGSRALLIPNGSDWQRTELFDFQRDIEGRAVENFPKRCGSFLQKFSLRGCPGVGDNALRMFAQDCRDLQVLHLNGSTKITDATCTSLSKFCSKLRHLDLASCTSRTALSLKALREGCPLLEELSISWCDQVTKDGIQALVRGCGGLKALFLKGCTQLEDEALKYIGAHCPVTLNLQTCLQITDDGLITIGRGSRKLQSLRASGCSNVTDAILNALGRNSPRLRILEAARCSQWIPLASPGSQEVLGKHMQQNYKQLNQMCPLSTSPPALQCPGQASS